MDNSYVDSSISPDSISYYETGDKVLARYGIYNMELESFSSNQHRVFSLDFRKDLAPYNKMRWNIQGLPSSKDGLSPGYIYVDNNGFLKVVPYI